MTDFSTDWTRDTACSKLKNARLWETAEDEDFAETTEISETTESAETTEKSETTGSADFAATAQFAEKQNRLQQEKQ